MPDQPSIGLVHIGHKQPSAQFLLNELGSAGYLVKQFEKEEVTGFDHSIKAYIINLYDHETDLSELIEAIESAGTKIIFNDAHISNELVGWNKNRWLRHVLHKIDQAHDILPAAQQHNSKQSRGVDLSHLGVQSVWILAASIGGPESLIKFFQHFDGSEPVLFLIVQHMDNEFVAMMEKQLNKNGQVPVLLAQSGEKIRSGTALLIPVEEDIVINADGVIAVKNINPGRMYTPCIDDVCCDMIENLKQVNVAVFSGMAKDGVIGATNVFENGGRVITQSASSCVVSAIADEIRHKNMSRFDGDPEAMAQYIKETTVR